MGRKAESGLVAALIVMMVGQSSLANILGKNQAVCQGQKIDILSCAPIGIVPTELGVNWSGAERRYVASWIIPPARREKLSWLSRFAIVNGWRDILARMEIQAPHHFVHAGDLDLKSASADPRRTDFSERDVDIDLRACEFIQPAAALWCAIYALLVAKRNANCRLLVPENLGVAIYLKSMELFRILQASGVEEPAEEQDPKLRERRYAFQEHSCRLQFPRKIKPGCVRSKYFITCSGKFW